MILLKLMILIRIKYLIPPFAFFQFDKVFDILE
jgi:hypothetical protein